MADNNTFITDISYTNKDFQSVYNEQLDLAEKLTDKWSPRMSNESDPGVVLLKLNSMIADKDNYNIDKNILEAFPVSVTQEKNARNLFEQLGYSMKWYRSATVDVSISWIGEEGDDYSYYKIPRFTMISNDDGTVVYTLIEDCYLTPGGTLYSEYVSDNSIVSTVKAIEGVVNEYTVDGNTVITLLNMDENNRIYFDINTISENGIFINNVRDDGTDLDNYLDWERVDNLAVQKLGSKLYKFGVDSRNNCYIEFPSDIDSLVGSGLRIHYLSSSGEAGNIKAGTLSKFYNDVRDTEYNIVLDSSNTLITNGSSTQNGSDPETIDEAYKNYKKIIGTFKTLVTLRDYENAINTSELVSNNFITDRTNDIQCAYSIVTDNGNLKGKKLIVETDSGTPKMDAFSLKMYLLNWVDNVYDKTSYNRTFSMVESMQPNPDVLGYIEDVKSIQHDFNDLEPMKPLMFKNKYPVTVKIIPQYTISEQQQREIENNVRLALYDKFNSKSIEFGEEITYDEVYEAIMNSDSRIKAIVLDELDYKTYAVIYDPTDENNKFKEILVSEVDPDYSELSNKYRLDIYTKSVLNGNTQLLKEVTDFQYGLNQEYINLVPGETGNVPVLENIESITTETVIPVTFNEQNQFEYEIRDNEKIVFYAPNLIDDVQYGNYIKYEYAYNGQDMTYYIPSNTDYKLNVGEKICLYYKTTDNDEDFYNYTTLETGTIIKTSFNMFKTVNTINDMIGKDLSGSGVVTQALQNKIVDMDTDLGANRTISVRKFNTKELNNSVNKCYWILNTKETDAYGDYYELFRADQREYILKSGEYFIYTNDTATALEILGQGTKLTLTGAYNRPWKVYAIDNSVKNIASSGISAFSDSDWFTFKGDTSQVVAQEMQFLTLIGGDSIRIYNENGEPFIINNTPADIDLNNYYIEYNAPSSSSSGSLPKLDVGSASWNVISNLGIRLSNNEPQVIQAGQTFTMYQKSDDGSIVSPVTISGDDGDKYIMSDSIVYKDGGEKVSVEFVDLEGNTTYLSTYAYAESTVTGTKIVMNKDGGCSMTFNNDIPTVYTEGMKFELSGNNVDIPYGGTEETLSSDNSKLMMFWKDSQYYYWCTYRKGSIVVNNMSADIPNTSTPTVSGIADTGKTAVGTALYNIIDSLSSIPSGKTIECTSSGFDNSIDFRLPEGKYIFKLRNNSSTLNKLTLSLSTWEETPADLYPVDDLYSLTKLTDFKDTKTAYLYVEIPDAPGNDYTKLHTLVFDINKEPSIYNESISIEKIYRYDDSDVSFESVLKHIVGYGDDAGLDPTGYYNYTYQVDDSVRIDDPLNADSFNDVNHIYNPFTICQIGVIDVKVINRIKGQ